MKAVIVYEAELAETRLVAEAIAVGLGDSVCAEVTVVTDTTVALVCPSDFLVLGTSHRGIGIRRWLEQVRLHGTACAVFSTRAAVPRRFDDSAAPALVSALRRSGGAIDTPPVAFLTEESGLLALGELVYAQQWGRQLGSTIARELLTAPRPAEPVGRR